MPYLSPADETLPYQSGSDTSRDAAIQAQDGADRQRERVYAYILGFGDGHGVTQKEAERFFLANPPAVVRAALCPRFHELERAGKIEKLDGVRREGCAAYRVR